ncbi:MAG: GNAT family N-acetyltransferase [Flavobacteriales bacterium]|nr:GNAT family N-acetyltransferase [Flavobacteriales bacterium]
MKIQQGNKSQINQLLLIANTAFGENFITKTELESYINHPNKYLFVAFTNDKIAGFITAEVCNKAELLSNLLQQINLPHQTITVGWIKQVVVTPNNFRKGIANKLLEVVTITLKTVCDTLFCISWKKGVVTPMSKLLEKNQFKLLQIAPNYWNNDSLLQQYSCNICGNPPCKCSAEFFIYLP